ncbi:hypothetical protein ACT8ZR_29040 [Neobacillus sp. M.A.Huq-85]
MKKLIFFIFLLGLSLCFNQKASANSACLNYYGHSKVTWNGEELKKGQIGKITILKKTNLYKLNGAKKTVIRQLKKGEVLRVYDTKPAFFRVSGRHYVTRNSDVKYEIPSKKKLLESYCVYSFDEEKVFKKRTKKILDGAKKYKSNIGKILFVHDELAKLIDYDWDGYNHLVETGKEIHYISHTDTGAIVYQRAYCDGYTEALNYLLNKLKIPAIEVDSWDMDHGWSLVKLDNKYYHIDLTWDDIDYGPKYKYFLVSDKAMRPGHYRWEDNTTYKATSKKYEYFSKLVSLQFDNNYIYYEKDGSIIRATYSNTNRTKLISTSFNIYNFVLLNNYIYSLESRYHDWDGDAIYRMDKNGKHRKLIFKFKGDLKKVFVKNGSLYYLNQNGKEFKVVEDKTAPAVT